MTLLKHSKLSFVLFICLVAFGCDSNNSVVSTSSAPPAVKKAGAIPAVQAGEEIAVIEMEEKTYGTVKIQLFSDVAPKHVENFKKLINEGFYNGLAFHRVIPDLIIQGGDPTTKGDDRSKWGMGMPDQPKVNAEFNDRPFIRGTLGAARGQDPNSASSQFFICVRPNPQWDGEYTNFGQVIEGLNNAQIMSNAPSDAKQVVTDKIIIKRMYLEKYKGK